MDTDNLLHADEAAWIRTNQERCAHCGHLRIFHSIGVDEDEDEWMDCDVDGCYCHE